MSIQNNIAAFTRIKEQIKEQKKILAELRAQEIELMKNIESFLNETGETGLRVDDSTIITLSQHDKKINKNKKNYEHHVQQLLYSKGISDDQFLKQLLDKTENIVQHQKLVVKKNK